MNGSRITKKMIQLDGGFGTGFGSVSTSRSIHVVPSLPKNQSAEYTVIISKLGYESDSSIVVLTGNVQHDRQLPLVHFHSFVIDLHNDVLEKVIVGYQIAIRHTTDHSDLPRMLEGGLDAQMFVSWPDPTKNIRNWHTATLAMIDSFKNIVTANSNIIAHARSVKEIQDANAAGKIAGILCVEGGHAIDSSLENLKDFYAKGARYFTITWNNSIGWAISAQDPLSATQGLNGFGRQVIQLMDSLGMIIDVAHTGIKTIEDILAVTKNPIIDSHAGARALRDHYRNLTDDQIRKIAAKGGVIGVVFYPSFISSVSRATIDTVIKHIDYIKNLVGIDYVAIGSDYDGMESAPAGLEDVSKLPNLTMALLKHGYSIPEVRKILGGNYMRVFQQVCK
jgi:membrane dipeptidase